ncbi:MAG: response regulator [bacterium]|nr:response regulator [bacterium]
MDTSEELREALLSLEDARKREAHQRRMAEALLAGLRVLVLTEDADKLFRKLFDVMREPLDFEAAFVLTANGEGTLKPVASSVPLFADTVWRPRAMFERVIGGQPVAVFDTHLVEEWSSQPAPVRRSVRSALHFSIHTTERKAVFVCTHSSRAHFSRDHVILARRFSMLATQALQKLESEAKLADLQERLNTEAKLAALNQKLVESEKKLARARKMEAVGLLAGGVAHDLNNILSGIVSYPELLLMEENLSPEHRDAIETIYESGLRAAAVIADLLTVARGAASSRETLNLNRIVRQYPHSPEHQALMLSYPGVTIGTDLAPDLLNIRASQVHVSKALLNLVTNAAEAVYDRAGGNVTISTENRYVDRPLKGYDEVRVGEFAVLSVADNGTGISDQDLDRIFEPFYARKAMGRSGTGLGLTVIWNAMQDHEGYIDVTTGEQGTTFALYFPVVREAVAEQGVRIPVEAYQGRGQTVLVVDDLEDQRKLASAMLKRLGYVAESVASGEEAVEYVKERPVDLIVLDMIMDPGINGREAYARIIKIRPGQKAVIASGFSQSDDVKAAQAMGAGQYLKKPYTLEKLGIALRDELKR